MTLKPKGHSPEGFFRVKGLITSYVNGTELGLVGSATPYWNSRSAQHSRKGRGWVCRVGGPVAEQRAHDSYLELILFFIRSFSYLCFFFFFFFFNFFFFSY